MIEAQFLAREISYFFRLIVVKIFVSIGFLEQGLRKSPVVMVGVVFGSEKALTLSPSGRQPHLCLALSCPQGICLQAVGDYGHWSASFRGFLHTTRGYVGILLRFCGILHQAFLQILMTCVRCLSVPGGVGDVLAVRVAS